MKKLFAIMCAVLAFSASGLKAEEAEASVSILTKQYNYQDFQGLSAGNAFKVSLVQDSKWFVEVEYSDFLEPYLDVSVSAGTLKLDLKDLPSSVRNSRKYKDGPVLNAVVHMPQLTKLNLSGAAKLQQEGRFALADGEFRMDLSGAARVDNVQVDARKGRLAVSGAAKCDSFEGTFYQLKVNLSGAAKGNFNATAEDWDVVVSGSSHVEISGQPCKTLDIESSGASKADVFLPSETLQDEGSGASSLQALDAPTGKAKVELSGSSRCRIAVRESLDVEASGASDCYYKAVDGASLRTRINTSRGSRVKSL